MNWNDLKTFCNQLNETQLTENVILWREDEAITDIDAQQLEEDQYIDKEEMLEGCFPKSEVDDFIKNQPEDYPNGLDHFKKVYDKGFPVLQENF